MICRLRDFIIVALILALISYLPLLQQELRSMRISQGLQDDLVLLPGEFATAFIFSGFRGLACDLLWLKVDEYWHTGKWYMMPQTLRAITWLQKDFMPAWGLASWHLAYNISRRADTEKEKQQYITDAIDLLKEGIFKNPGRYDLYYELGWLYFDRLQDYDSAIKYFRKAIKFEHPMYIDRLIANCYMKKGDLESAKMEWERCLRLPGSNMYHLGIAKKNLKTIEEQLRVK